MLCVRLVRALQRAGQSHRQPSHRERRHYVCPKQTEDLVADWEWWGRTFREAKGQTCRYRFKDWELQTGFHCQKKRCLWLGCVLSPSILHSSMITGSQVVGRVPAGGHVVIPRGGGCSALKSPAVRRQTADLPFVQVHQTSYRFIQHIVLFTTNPVW